MIKVYNFLIPEDLGRSRKYKGSINDSLIYVDIVLPDIVIHGF